MRPTFTLLPPTILSTSGSTTTCTSQVTSPLPPPPCIFVKLPNTLHPQCQTEVVGKLEIRSYIPLPHASMSGFLELKERENAAMLIFNIVSENLVSVPTLLSETAGVLFLQKPVLIMICFRKDWSEMFDIVVCMAGKPGL